MRVLHTADWHLGRRVNRVSRLEEQRELMDDLVQETSRLDPDVVVVAGDVYDVFTPGADAERLFYDTVGRLADDGRRPVLVVAGNHDSPAKLTAPRRLLEDQGVFVYGTPHDPDDVPEPRQHPGFEVQDAAPGWLQLDTEAGPACFHLLPFPSRARLPSRVDDPELSASETVAALGEEVPPGSGERFLVGHLYVGGSHDVEEDTDDYVGGAYAVDPGVLETYDATFLGHLHRPFGHDNWRYAGAPMAFDFDDPELARGAWLYEDGVGETIELEGDRRLVEHQVGSPKGALALAEEDEEAWVRLVFERGTVVERQNRQRLREAFGSRLVDIRFAEAEEEVLASPSGFQPGDLDPEQAFRAYVEDEDGSPPDDELVELFLDVLEPHEGEPATDGEAEAEQATLEVES